MNAATALLIYYKKHINSTAMQCNSFAMEISYKYTLGTVSSQLCFSQLCFSQLCCLKTSINFSDLEQLPDALLPPH